jgi:uncharacterized RDD family membrane protein YckC
MLRVHRRPPLDTVTDIDTPERIRFACRLAGPGQRAAAYLLDLLVRGAVLMAAFIGATALELVSGSWSGMGVGIGLALLFALEWGYYVACELMMQGQSVGKRAFRLRVVQSDGLPIGLSESVLRNLLRAADFLPSFYVLGVLVMGFDPKFRRLGDWLAGTLVISEGSEPVLPVLTILPAPTQEELLPLPARVPLSVDELDAIEEFLRRRVALPRARELELAELVAPIFAQRLSVRYTDPSRFLALLYHRARRSGAA